MTASDTAGDPSLRQRFPIYPSQLLTAMAMVSIGPLLDQMMRDLAIPLQEGGIISAGLFLGNVVGIIVLNATMARVSAKRTLASGAALLGIGLVVAGAASRDLWSLALSYVLVGIGGALMLTTCWAWLAVHMKKNMAASALAMTSLFGVAMVVVPLVIGLAIDNGATWRWILVAEGAIGLATAAVFAFLPLLDIPGRRNVRLAHLKEVATYDPRLLLGLMAAGLLYTGTETTINVWLPKFQIDVFGAQETWASLAVTLFWVGLVLGRLIMMPLTWRFSPSRLLLICSSTLAVFAVAVACAPTRGASLALSVGAGLGASASYGIIGSYVGRFPARQSGVASSLFILAGSMGSITFPYIMGPLASAAGFRIALAVTAVPALAYGLISLSIPARSGEGRSRP